MSRTKKAEPFNIFAKEKKPYRKTLHKIWRRDRKQAVRTGREPLPEKKTGGWMTW